LKLKPLFECPNFLIWTILQLTNLCGILDNFNIDLINLGLHLLNLACIKAPNDISTLFFKILKTFLTLVHTIIYLNLTLNLLLHVVNIRCLVLILLQKLILLLFNFFNLFLLWLVFLLVIHYLVLQNWNLFNYLLLVFHKVLKDFVFLHQL
jgi:hypothetical protein